MRKKLVVDQTFRAWAILVAIAGAFSGVTALGWLAIEPVTLGVLWVGLAATGLVLLAVLVMWRDEFVLADADPARLQRFRESWLTGWPLQGYLGTLGVLTLGTIGWMATGGTVIEAQLLGLAWAGVAVFGAVVTIGLVTTHWATVQEALAPSFVDR